MDISQIFSLFSQNQQNQPNQSNPQPNNQQTTIPQDVLNSYPSTYIDSPTTQRVQIQNIQQSPPQAINPINQNQPQNPLSMLMNMLPSLFNKGNFDISSLMNMLGGGKTNILSNLLNNNKHKSSTKKSQQKNSPNYDELKKVNDYEFDD